MACSKGCPTPGAHASWGDCIRAKSVKVEAIPGSIMKAFRTEQKAYADAKRQGIQPDTTQMPDIQRAIRQAGA